jgi:hypothetical protein
MERLKDQRPTRLHATGELFPPDKEEDGYARGYLFCFSLLFSPFSPLYYKYNPNPPLEAIKGEAEAKKKKRQQYLEPTSIETRLHAPPPTRDLGPASSLEKCVTPTTSTSVQGNMNRRNTHWT